MGSSLWVGPADEPDAYQILESLGAGGEGEVWRAIRPLSEEGASHSVVAIKTFGPETTNRPASSWSRHVSLLQALRHPGIVRVIAGFVGPPRHWAGEAAKHASSERYLVMEHVEGTALSDRHTANLDADLPQRMRVIRQVAAALDYLHSGVDTNDVEVAHGDIKPGNLLVQGDGRVILVDFGLANLADGTAKLGMGTPGYMAPELIAAGRQARPTPDGDRFALAATLVYLLTGQSPPPRRDSHGHTVDVDRDAARQALAGSPPLQGMPAQIDLILQGLAQEPGERPRSLVRWLADVGSQTISGSAPTGAGEPAGLRPVTASNMTTMRPNGPGTGGPHASEPGITPLPPGRTRQYVRHTRMYALAALIVVVLGGIGYLATRPDGSPSGSGSGANSISSSPLPAAIPTATASAATASAAKRSVTDSSASGVPTVAPGGPMPSLRGVSLDQAKQTLASADVTVIVETRLDASTTDNVVVAQDPPAGTTLTAGQQVTLTVARTQVLTYLADLRATTQSPTAGTRTVNGVTYPHSISTDVYCMKTASFEYDLGRHYRRLQAMIGVADDAPYGDKKVLFEVFADGAQIYHQAVGLGESKQLDLDVTGKLRLKLTQSYVSGTGCAGYNVWGDAALIGAEGEVPQPSPTP
ncbi:protein kinase domain-containing protein [Frankia sp. AgKG'84/4]|uniref:protein kinase domain-containing protein n=1 Tax=Frankia sp. AgKG'84/4 TaxID=573490 RepID=UPI00201083CC|nr:protein kinase [Frankia sp. AgKG'84/4]MCL9793480.1 protein kinase [Frankia sp. AgKG'84/4]